ncbi:XRE family transcriptional regulator [Streptomyces sp. NPDC054904]|uniref:XRE family transcriptional regulator n=1 Tax=unclassified Streptomyces TaxID=2593676 RepID=UPI002481E6B8|nr:MULTISPECIES: XRE family transcriptional regulator [unclassified Streptomyces]MDA5283998.1 XRE family transcriptional regulator [Streptomyces sp. Isolate_45]MDX2390615.1 XRE family transcriptional regulator [Streptomyces sp. DK15]
MSRPEPTPEAIEVGRAIRGCRTARRVSMAVLATRSGLSQPFLSQLERGLATPSLSSIYRIAEALDVAPGTFLRRPDRPGVVSHESDPQVIRVSEAAGQVAKVLIPGGSSGLMEAYEHHFEPGRGERGWFEHPGEDFLYVLEGELVLEVEGEEPLVLRAGQSAHHRGEIPHRCGLGGRTAPARTLLVIANA